MSINVYIGWDSRFPICSDVLAYSICKNTNVPINIKIHFLKKYRIKQLYGIKIKHDPLATTEFTYTRFLVPWINNYKGLAIFMDNDMLCYGNIFKDLIDKLCSFDNCLLDTNLKNSPALWARKHLHQAHTDTKMYGVQQTRYPRKNWSSFMVMNCMKLRCWGPLEVAEANGKRLHRFEDIPDNEIEDIPKELGWNDLIHKSENCKLLHYTEGGPWYKNYKDCPHANEWRNAHKELTGIDFVPTL